MKNDLNVLLRFYDAAGKVRGEQEFRGMTQRDFESVVAQATETSPTIVRFTVDVALPTSAEFATA